MVTSFWDQSFFKLFGKFLQTVLQILLFLLLPIVIFTTVTSRTDIIKGIHSFVVVTGSMQPTLPVGSMIYTTQAIAYKPHDIIAFKNASGQTVTHRISDIQFGESTMYTTKGDANSVADSTPVAVDDVTGKVIFHVPYVGYFTNFLKTPIGFLSFIIFPSLIFIGCELWNIKKEMEKEIEKRMLEKLLAQNKTQ